MSKITLNNGPKNALNNTLKSICAFLLLLCLHHGTAYAQKSATAFDAGQLKVRWELIENNYRKQPQFLSALTISNTGQSALPEKGWALYFNYISEIRPQSVTGNVIIEHVNGDIFRLRPAPGFKGIAGRDSLRVEFVTGDEALNVSDAPSGLYLVWDEVPGTGIPITGYSITPISDSTMGLLTPAKLYNQNWYTRDIPAEELPKIFPTPAQYRETGGELLLTPATPIILADISFQREAGYLSDKLAELWGRKPPAGSGSSSHQSESAASGPSSSRSGASAMPPPTLRISGKPAITLQKDTLPAEAYRLDIDKNGITIAAGDPSGIFYGIQSLLSLLPPSAWGARQMSGKVATSGTVPASGKAPMSLKVPMVSVKDAPRFGFRGFSLDVARNFQTKKEVEKMLDLMALYKLNVLHFHFSDDEGWRIEIPTLPELTEIGSRRGHTLDSRQFLPASFGDGPDPDHSFGTGFYTKADFIEILTYAKERHIEVIPEIESPGHARAAIKAMDVRYERLMGQGRKEEAERYLLRDINDRSKYSSNQLWNDNVMCVGLPSTYRFLEAVVDDLAAMYKEAGAPLTTIHVGGDEVPAGVWEQSPVCKDLIQKDPSLHSTDDLWYYYFANFNALLDKRGLYLSGWEEISMRKTVLDKDKKMIPNPGFVDKRFRVHVWNNMIGSGTDDLPYRLANAGYKVVLTCVNNMYFDLAYNKSPSEAGYYWGGYTDLDKPFYFIPYDYYKNAKEDQRGVPIDPSTFFIGKDRLTEYGKSNIAGIEGAIWSENIHGPERLEYMLLPKLLGMAERAWAKDPEWATEKDGQRSRQLYDQAWSRFLNIVGKRELPRLDYYAGGFAYRIPQPGVITEDGSVKANIQIPGLTLRYTVNGGEPTAQSDIYTRPVMAKGLIRVKAFDARGRSGQEAEVENP
jgi:hexosaminidase